MRGYFAIGIWHPKTASNVGTLWRTAHAFGAAFLFTVGRRFPRQASDTVNAWKTVPMLEFQTIDDLVTHLPFSCPLVAVENTPTARRIDDYSHPERAVYLLGSEDNGLSPAVIERCHGAVILPGAACLNVATAGAMLMYDRATKRGESVWSPRSVTL